jgi:hypothetical protein
MHDIYNRAEQWIASDCWVAYFDILGISNLMSIENDDPKAFLIRLDYEETIGILRRSCEEYDHGSLDYCWFSDTFLMFTADDSPKSYSVIQFAAKIFINRCLYSRIPIRGAISVGSFMRSQDNRSFIGNAFIDAYKYGEDQDWLGLIITPRGITKAESYNLYPNRHDFVRSDKIPMRKLPSNDVMAYRFQNGEANFPSPLLPILKDMKTQSGEEYRGKYERTEQFIIEHYRWMK